MNNLRVACAALFSLMIIVAGCNKSSNTTSVPFQGPQNPSFETLGSWYVTYTASGGTYQGGSFVDIVTGTGRLTISLNAEGGLNPHTSPSAVTETNIALGIDNISVK